MAKKDAKDEKLVAADAADVKEKTTEETAKAPAVAETKTDEAPAIEEKFAKAGKKSKKHIEEVRAEEERQARKLEAAAEPEKKVGPRPVTRSRLERRGKNYRKVSKKIEKGKAYSLADALKLAIETSPVKFDATLEMHFRLGVDPRQADQNIRATVTLPAGTGKDVRVAVFAPLDVCKTAKIAGADIAEDEEFTAKLDKEQLDFDVLVSTPQYMPKLGKYARLLGPKGLMPNPKLGTVTMDVKGAVSKAKAGQVEFRAEKSGVVHAGLGKLSFGEQKLEENVRAFVEVIQKAKPASSKGTYIKAVSLSTTQGIGLKIDLSDLK